MAESTGDQSVLCQIANCAFGVVSGLLERDQRLAEELRSSAANSFQIVREEQITLDMVSLLRERFPSHVEVTLFTGPEESRNGADWYWRIQKSTGAIHARVQAKRIQRSSFGQMDSGAKVDLDIAQLNRLVAVTESDRENFPSLQSWLATYARFSAEPPCRQEPSNCKWHGCDGECAGQGSPSIWIAHATDIVARINPLAEVQTISVKDIVQKSLRLDCVLPCIGRPNDDGPAAKGFQLNIGLPTYETCVERIRADPLLQSTFQGAMQVRF
jgi:hypothetical protein